MKMVTAGLNKMNNFLSKPLKCVACYISISICVSTPFPAFAEQAEPNTSNGEDWSEFEPVNPSDWVTIAGNSSGTVWLIRRRDIAISHIVGNRQVWIEWNHSMDRSVPHRKTLSLIEFNCDRHSSATVSYILYRADGSVVANHDFSYLDYSPSPPGSMIEIALDSVCGTNLP
jgi:hypothetical protein